MKLAKLTTLANNTHMLTHIIQYSRKNAHYYILLLSFAGTRRKLIFVIMAFARVDPFCVLRPHTTTYASVTNFMSQDFRR